MKKFGLVFLFACSSLASVQLKQVTDQSINAKVEHIKKIDSIKNGFKYSVYLAASTAACAGLYFYLHTSSDKESQSTSSVELPKIDLKWGARLVKSLKDGAIASFKYLPTLIIQLALKPVMDFASQIFVDFDTQWILKEPQLFYARALKLKDLLAQPVNSQEQAEILMVTVNHFTNIVESQLALMKYKLSLLSEEQAADVVSIYGRMKTKLTVLIKAVDDLVNNRAVISASSNVDQIMSDIRLFQEIELHAN